jgi:Tfp pilus assembly protein PilN
MGLALRQTSSPKAVKGETARFQDISINVLSGKCRKAIARPASAKRTLTILVLAVVLAAMFFLYQSLGQIKLETAHLQVELSRIDQELYQAELDREQADQMAATIGDITAAAMALEREQETILAQQDKTTVDLEMVTRVLPPQVHLTSIDMEAERLTLHGEAISPYDIVSYALALEALERFPEVRVIEIDEATPATDEETGAATPGKQSYPITFSIAISRQ